MASAAADKARFYMEQSVPELQELLRKQIFTQAEITAIASKRSEFEHILNMPGASTPADYARYATYEMNLDTLRKRRSKRLGVKSTVYAGQKKIFNVLERGTRKFAGDMGLWMQLLSFCAQEKANKKLVLHLTRCLRLHPRKWELWVWAARWYVEDMADMTTARSYMQRGLRFCADERKLWVQYARLEIGFVAKIAARRRILGLDEERREEKKDSGEADFDNDEIALPTVTAEDINPDLKRDAMDVDQQALEKLSSSPALSGAIPSAIFDAAMKHFRYDVLLAEQFFELFTEYPDVPCTPRLLEHCITTVDANIEKKNAAVVLAACRARSCLLGMDVQSADFPLALGRALKELKVANAQDAEVQQALSVRAVTILLPYLVTQDELDEGVRAALEASVARNVKVLHSSKRTARGSNPLVEARKQLAKNRKIPTELLVKHGIVETEDG